MVSLKGNQKTKSVAEMFSRISQRYDFLNTLMTAGRHNAWRRLAVGMVAEKMNGDVLDVASGTGDFSIEILKLPDANRVIGLDCSESMLRIADKKVSEKRINGVFTPLMGDAHKLPFPDNSFSCVVVGFGIRNFADTSGAMTEIIRVVAPGGALTILEIVKPKQGSIMSRVFPFFFRQITPRLGSWFADDEQAYKYLPESVQVFMSSEEIVVQVLEGDNAISKYRKIMGATDPQSAEEGTIRNQVAISKQENSVHGSDSIENATKEINFFFKIDEIVG